MKFKNWLNQTNRLGGTFGGQLSQAAGLVALDLLAGGVGRDLALGHLAAVEGG